VIVQTPSFLSLLGLLPVIAVILIRSHRLRQASASALRGEREQSTLWPRLLARRLAVFAILIVALARPGWNPRPSPRAGQGRDLVIALDVSRSMLAADVFPSRLESAKIVLHEGLAHLQGQRIGLILFAGAASVQVPLTHDHNFVRYMLDRASPYDADIGSTSLQAAIEKAIHVVLKESEKGRQDIIIFTDGEDHISDIEKTAAALHECSARVLIIGLGDPVAGSRVPGVEGTNEWMQYEGHDVISRLNEETLVRLSAESPNVTYYPATTRPFDLTALYRQTLTTSQHDTAVDGGPTLYSETYPFLIALALLLLFIPLSRRLPLHFAALLIASCTPVHHPTDIDHAAMTNAGYELWSTAQESLQSDPPACLLLLSAARNDYLRAALLRPGDETTAQHIAGITRQIHSVEATLRERQQKEEDLQQRISSAIEQLRELERRQTKLSLQGQRLLRKRPRLTQPEGEDAAAPALTEQADVQRGTSEVRTVLCDVRSTIQGALAMAFAQKESPAPTEFDAPINALNAAQHGQRTALSRLTPSAVNWTDAHSSMVKASRQMREALRMLSEQTHGQEQPQDGGDDGEFSDEMEWSESEAGESTYSMPMSSQEFKTALENRDLPSPNYTAEDILSQEEANQEKRTRQKAGRSGAGVEKNW